MAKGQPAKGTSGSRMKSAWKLFEAGDVVAARREAKAALADSPSEAETEQAKDLIDRTRAPKFAWYMALMAAALIITMVAVGIAHH
jgi:hypothetical protein